MLMSAETRTSSCVWIIETRPSTTILLNLFNIDLPGGCDSSYLIIRAGDHSMSPFIVKYCGYVDFDQKLIQSNKIWLEYKTPTNNIGRFLIKWSENGADGKFLEYFLILFKSLKNIFYEIFLK